jgi:hypothetical protein
MAHDGDRDIRATDRVCELPLDLSRYEGRAFGGTGDAMGKRSGALLWVGATALLLGDVVGCGGISQRENYEHGLALQRNELPEMSDLDLESLILFGASAATIPGINEDSLFLYTGQGKNARDERERRRANGRWNPAGGLPSYDSVEEQIAAIEFHLSKHVAPDEVAYYTELLASFRAEAVRRTSLDEVAAAAPEVPAPAPAIVVAPPPPAPAPRPSAPPPSAPPASLRARGEVIAVFDLEDPRKSLGAGDVEQLTDYFAVQLSTLGFKVVPRSQIKGQLASEKQETYKACYDEGCQIELGKAVAAQKSVATKLIKMGSTCALTATMYDLRTETTDIAASVDTRCGQDELLAGLKQLARQLVSQ